MMKSKIAFLPVPRPSSPAPSLLSTIHYPLSTFLLLLLFAASALAGEADTERSAALLITPEAARAAERGLKWLASKQHEDGGFGSGPMRGNAGVCALAAVAMMADGSTPGRGPFGDCVNRCVDYLLSGSQPSGFISGPDASRGPMYGHGFATMLLSECYGMSPKPELREKLSKAVKIIVNSQNKQGGWRYQPVRADAADVSVTVCQIMALRAARNAGLFVPNETVDRAIDYVKRSQNADGGFMYMIQGGESAFPRSAAAVAALFSAGIYEGSEIDRGLEYLVKFSPGNGADRRESYYFYGQYYAVQAFWQAGGERLDRWYPAARDELVARQKEDGSWSDATGNECATAMACVVLVIPKNYVPIFQR